MTIDELLMQATKDAVTKSATKYHDLSSRLPLLREAIENQQTHKVRLYLTDMMAHLNQLEVFESEFQAKMEFAQDLKKSL